MRLVALVALILLATASTVQAQDLDARALELYRNLKCPICDTSLEQSNTQIATDMKALIRQKLAQGESTETITAYFVDRYGEAILVAPAKTTQNLLAWTVPGLALLAGIGLVSVLLRSVRRTPNANPADDPIDPAMNDLLDHELAEGGR